MSSLTIIKELSSFVRTQRVQPGAASTAAALVLCVCPATAQNPTDQNPVHVGNCGPMPVLQCSLPPTCKENPVYGGIWIPGAPRPKGTACTVNAEAGSCNGAGLCIPPASLTDTVVPRYEIVTVLLQRVEIINACHAAPTGGKVNDDPHGVNGSLLVGPSVVRSARNFILSCVASSCSCSSRSRTEARPPTLGHTYKNVTSPSASSSTIKSTTECTSSYTKGGGTIDNVCYPYSSFDPCESL